MVSARFPTRIAVIGAGLAAAPHLASLRDLAAKARVVWFVGRGLDCVAAAAVWFPGAEATASLDDVFGDATVAAALVLTPPNTHLDIASRPAGRIQAVLLSETTTASVAARYGHATSGKWIRPGE